MGRKRKYFTDEDIKLARRVWAKTYYNKNKDRIDNIQRKKYHSQKNGEANI